MALRELVEGDCGGPSSLVRLTSHFIQDHGFKEEGIHRPFLSPENFEVADSSQLVKQFLEETAAHPQTFRMDNLLQEMREIDQTIHPPIPAPGVVKELTGQDTAWANQYLESGRHFDENHLDEIWNHPIEAMVPIAPMMPETHELGLGPKWAEEYLEQSIDTVDKDIEQDHFSGAPPDADTEDPNFAYSKFMKFMRQEGDIPIDSSQASMPNFERLDDKWTKEFEESSEGAESTSNKSIEKEDSILNKVEEELAAAGTWADEFSKENIASSDMDNYESTFWTHLQQEWEKISTEDPATSHPWISEYNKYYDPFKEYIFREGNPLKNLENPLEEGEKRLEAGDLPSAVLCFEAAVQQDTDNSKAWFLLGKTQAENEQDPLAISALKRCLTLGPTNCEALMALAVSYTNESYQNQACLTLKEWLTKNDKYKHLAAASTSTSSRLPRSSVSTILFSDLHNEVKELYIQAARMNPQDEIDADVQCGLGVLFNLSSEYDKAADCFSAALSVRPNDSRLWSRYGATLANGQRSEEAVDAYHRALELSPGFIRARYNLGISCINLGAYKAAGEHLLTALNQQAAGQGIQGETTSLPAMSNSIWSTLRLVVSLMHKYHLNEAIENRDLAKLNEEFEIE